MKSANSYDVIKDLSKKHQILKTNIRILENNKWLIKSFELKHPANYVTIIKKYFDKNGLLMIEFSILNKKESVLNKNYDNLNKLLAEAIVTNMNISNFNCRFSKINSDQIIIDAAKTLGWKNEEFIYEKFTSSNDKNWIEKTIRVIRPEAFHVKYKILQNSQKNI